MGAWRGIRNRAARVAAALRNPCNIGLLAALGVVLATTGCASPNTYATARTLAPGDITHTLAVEGVGYHGPQGTGALPVLPTYVFRVGVIDRVDVGARLGSLTEIGADVKVNFLRGRLDLALAGGAEAFLEWHYEPHGDRPPRRTGSRAYFQVPLIASYNFSKKVSIVGTPGIAYIVGNNVSDDFVRTQPFDGGTLAARLGLGIDYRWRKRRALHPEVTVLQSLRASETLVTFGLGFNFGDIPNYDDVEREESKPAEQAPAPAEPPSRPAEPPGVAPEPAAPPPSPETPPSHSL